jgi:hypothetical protein
MPNICTNCPFQRKFFGHDLRLCSQAQALFSRVPQYRRVSQARGARAQAVVLCPTNTAIADITDPMKKTLLIYFSSLLLTACDATMAPIVGCDALGDIQPVCEMQSPEDIAALADGRHLLLSNFGGMKNGTGSLSLFDTHTNKLTSLFPPLSGRIEIGGRQWGEPGCPPPSPRKFSPHGTHLHQLADGRWRYLVVNHGARESIEMFELRLAGSDSSLTWRGCLLPEADTFMNDVVGLANGDLVFSRMFHSDSDVEMFKSLLGIPTGDLWRWSSTDGLRILPGTDAAQPNGLEISADERFVFANMYMEGEVWKVNAETGEKLAVGQVANADNSAWGSDGRLWVATHTAPVLHMLSCLANQSDPCGASFEIVAIDSDTMEAEVVFAHSGAPMGAVTVAVPQAGRVYMGSFVGDRLISVPASSFSSQ